MVEKPHKKGGILMKLLFVKLCVNIIHNKRKVRNLKQQKTFVRISVDSNPDSNPKKCHYRDDFLSKPKTWLLMTFLLHNFVHTPGNSHEVKVFVHAHIMIKFLEISYDDEPGGGRVGFSPPWSWIQGTCEARAVRSHYFSIISIRSIQNLVFGLLCAVLSRLLSRKRTFPYKIVCEDVIIWHD